MLRFYVPGFCIYFVICYFILASMNAAKLEVSRRRRVDVEAASVHDGAILPPKVDPPVQHVAGEPARRHAQPLALLRW